MKQYVGVYFAINEWVHSLPIKIMRVNFLEDTFYFRIYLHLQTNSKIYKVIIIIIFLSYPFLQFLTKKNDKNDMIID